ncbi:MAG: hypothetical protein GEU97_07920 [Actinophytocola sp.]|nr:hypothetical protein [Actinophytocola sp.]
MADRTEQRLRDALTACADQVTEESLSLPPELPRPKRRRWPALAAAAAVFVLTAGLAVVLLNVDRDYQPVAPPPAPSQPAPTTTSPEPPTCSAGERCVVQQVEVRGETLEVVGAKAPEPGDGFYQAWVLRVRGGDEIANGGVADGSYEGEAPGLKGRINAYVRADSLECFAFDGDPAVCLLDTYDLGDTNDVLGLSRTSSGWYFDARYPTPFGKDSIDVRKGDDGGFRVVAVQHDPFLADQPNWWARVWRWGGPELGCTEQVRTKQELPGWPEVNPDPATLDKDNCGGF